MAAKCPDTQCSNIAGDPIGDRNHYDIIKIVVETMYQNGSNTRSEKSGNPESLIDSVYANEKRNKPSCVGLWKTIPETIRNIIKDKKIASSLSLEQQKKVVQTILNHHDRYSFKERYYCYVPKKVRDLYEEFLKDYESSDKKLLENCLNFRSIFVDQERQKSGI